MNLIEQRSSVNIDELLRDLPTETAKAVEFFWTTRQSQIRRQHDSGLADAGQRAAVTGGKQMDGFTRLITAYLQAVGIERTDIFLNKRVELPGFFRATKEWDLLTVVDGHLLCVLELKSQVGPSFGNNFNNRTEEAMGSACDLWTAFREGAFKDSIRPWLGYAFLLEDADGSSKPVRVDEPHFRVFPEFVNASYKQRYELFCRKLVRERLYDTAAFLTSHREHGLNGEHDEPAIDLTFQRFVRSLLAHVIAHKGA